MRFQVIKEPQPSKICLGANFNQSIHVLVVHWLLSRWHFTHHSSSIGSKYNWSELDKEALLYMVAKALQGLFVMLVLKNQNSVHEGIKC